MRFFISGLRGGGDVAEWLGDLKLLTEYEYFESSPAPGEAEARARERFARELDYAFFAARLGWTPEQYGSLTQIERLFVRKELETVMVERTNLFQEAAKLAFVNAWNGKKYQIFKKHVGRDETITDDEVARLAAACKENPPWVPWGSKNG